MQPESEEESEAGIVSQMPQLRSQPICQTPNWISTKQTSELFIESRQETQSAYPWALGIIVSNPGYSLGNWSY